MTFTPEERIMYEVMTAVYNSGIPMSFKGSMVLRACLSEVGYAGDVRHTVDIDGNWHGDALPSAERRGNPHSLCVGFFVSPVVTHLVGLVREAEPYRGVHYDNVHRNFTHSITVTLKWLDISRHSVYNMIRNFS